MTYLGGSVYVLWSGYQISRQYQNKNKIILVMLLAFLLGGVAANQLVKMCKVGLAYGRYRCNAALHFL